MVVGQDMPFRRDREPCSPALQRYFGRQRAALAKMPCEFMPDHAHVELNVEDAIRVVAREVAKPVLGSIWPGLVTRSAACLIDVLGPDEIWYGARQNSNTGTRELVRRQRWNSTTLGDKQAFCHMVSP